MVGEQTKYSKRQEAIQEAYFVGKHLRKSKGKRQFMDARNKWNRARNVIERGDFVRVSSRAVANPGKGKAMRASLRKQIGGRVNALESISRGSMKRALNAVVEVKYTTDKLEVIG
jgi:hypothetical protein